MLSTNGTWKREPNANLDRKDTQRRPRSGHSPGLVWSHQGTKARRLENWEVLCHPKAHRYGAHRYEALLEALGRQVRHRNSARSLTCPLIPILSVATCRQFFCHTDLTNMMLHACRKVPKIGRQRRHLHRRTCRLRRWQNSSRSFLTHGDPCGLDFPMRVYVQSFPRDAAGFVAGSSMQVCMRACVRAGVGERGSGTGEHAYIHTYIHQVAAQDQTITKL